MLAPQAVNVMTYWEARCRMRHIISSHASLHIKGVEIMTWWWFKSIFFPWDSYFILFLVDSLKKSSETIYFNKIVKIETWERHSNTKHSLLFHHLTPFCFYKCSDQSFMWWKVHSLWMGNSILVSSLPPHLWTCTKVSGTKARLIESEATTAPESVWRRTKRDNLKLLQCFSCFLWSIVNSLLSSSYPRVVFRLRASVFRPKTTGHRAASTRH